MDSVHIPQCPKERKRMDKLKELLKEESASIYFPPEEIIDEFLAKGELLNFDTYDNIIDIGEIKPDIYILKSGVLQKVVVHNEQEITHNFGTEGTIFMSYSSFLLNQPSCIRISACCKCEVYRIRQKDFKELLSRYNEFSLWFLHVCLFQLYTYDYKSSIKQGDALSRYNKMMADRPEIFQQVPLKMIASYLGITQQHLSRIRRQ